MAKRVPASIRYKNPGAMWGNALAVKWGASPRAVTLNDGKGQGNNIAVFPTFVHGICAQLDLWRSSKHYKNKRLEDAIDTWSGGNNVASYIKFLIARVPDLARDTVMNDAFWKSESGIAFLKAQAWHEAGQPYPAPDEDWIEARRRVFAQGKDAKSKTIVTARGVGATLGAATTTVATVNAVVGPVNETVTQVRDVTDQAGQVVATTKEIVQVVPDTWLSHLTAFARTPGFLVAVIVVICAAWALTYFLRRNEHPVT